MKTFRIEDCNDCRIIYGLLEIESPEVTSSEVQEKIDEIKSRFQEEGNDEWAINELFERFPSDWVWRSVYDDHDCRVLV